MISKVQSKELHSEAVMTARPKLTTLERGMLTWVVLDPGDRVLDVNTRDGLMLEYLQRNMECDVCGMASTMEQVKRSRSRLQNADIVYGQAEDIPWRENSFDAVLVRKNGQEKDAWNRVLKEVSRVLKPGGQLLIGATCYPAPIRQIANLLLSDHDAEIRQPYESKSEVIQTLQDAGYAQVTWQQADLVSGIAIGWKLLQDGESV